MNTKEIISRLKECKTPPEMGRLFTMVNDLIKDLENTQPKSCDNCDCVDTCPLYNTVYAEWYNSNTFYCSDWQAIPPD